MRRNHFRQPSLLIATALILLISSGVPGHAVSAQATDTPLPTETSTPSPTETPTALSECADEFEPNDRLGSGPLLMSDQPLLELTLNPTNDVDFFQMWVKANRYYQVDTATLAGVDTRLRAFNAAGDLLAENDDFMAGDPASRLKFQAPAIDGWLFVAVDSLVPIAWGCRAYNISMTDISAPTPTPTTTPKPTTQPGPTTAPAPTNTALPTHHDAYEPNYDFATAADIGTNQVADLNFFPYPPSHSGPDNDFFRVYAKTGQILNIETTDLAPGVDTNIIMYRADAVTVIEGNDDCTAGQLYSCLEWRPDYTGYAYILVGPVGLTPKGVSAEALTYRLRVVDLAGQPTPTAPVTDGSYGQPLPWSAEPPLTPTLIPTLTPTPEPQLHLRTFSLAPPTPTPLPLQPVVVELTIYYDENDNKAPDSEEGVTGMNLQILDSFSNRMLGQAFTNDEGHATVFVSAAQKVRLSVPYLGYSQEIAPPGKQLLIRIPAVHLPSLIP